MTLELDLIVATQNVNNKFENMEKIELIIYSANLRGFDVKKDLERYRKKSALIFTLSIMIIIGFIAWGLVSLILQ